MGIYATGQKSKAICDRCGDKIPYPQLKTEWNGLRVCYDCWDPKHPQLTPRSVADAQAIYMPRPGTHSREDATYRLWRGVGAAFSTGQILSIITTTDAPVTGETITSAVGEETVLGGVVGTGLQATSAVGTVTPVVSIVPSGSMVATAVGDQWGHILAIETGLQATSAVGTVTPVVSDGWGGESFGVGAWGE